MTTREQWLALAERCEKATGLTWQDAHELDASIALAVGWTHAARGKERSKWWRAPEAPKYSRHDRPPRLSTSLDAITALIERKLPGWACSSGRTPDEFRLLDEPSFTASLMGNISEIQLGYDEPPEIDYDNHEGKAATEAPARCAAFCRAMAEKATE